jgi:hypothetical protein
MRIVPYALGLFDEVDVFWSMDIRCAVIESRPSFELSLKVLPPLNESADRGSLVALTASELLP